MKIFENTEVNTESGGFVHQTALLLPLDIIISKFSFLCTFKLTIPGFPYNLLPVSCGNIGFLKR
jgi:hypothetical protein